MARGIDLLRDAVFRAHEASERLCRLRAELPPGTPSNKVQRAEARWQAAAEYREILRRALEREMKNPKWKDYL